MFSISNILLPADFSAACRGAAKYTSALARLFNSQVTVLHVAMPLDAALGMESGAELGDFAATARESLIRQLNDAFWNQLRGLKPNFQVIEGDPATEIVRYAHDKHVDLIVMPTQGYGPFRRFLLGSVTAKVLHDVSCPVWTGVHLEKFSVADEIEFRQIACAVDLEPQTSATLCWAADMAKAMKATLHVIHALPCVSDGRWQQRMTDIANDNIKELRQSLNVDADVHLVAGATPVAVSEAAENIGADLLVIGRGHGTGHGGQTADECVRDPA